MQALNSYTEIEIEMADINTKYQLNMLGKMETKG